MQKVTSYCLVECREVRDYLDKGWQPWGSAVVSWDGRGKSPHQPMVRYEDKETERGDQ